RGIAHRLHAAFEVDDRQAGVAERDAVEQQTALRVRAAVAKRGEHALQRALEARAAILAANPSFEREPRHAAHGSISAARFRPSGADAFPPRTRPPSRATRSSRGRAPR